MNMSNALASFGHFRWSEYQATEHEGSLRARESFAYKMAPRQKEGASGCITRKTVDVRVGDTIKVRLNIVVKVGNTTAIEPIAWDKVGENAEYVFRVKENALLIRRMRGHFL